MLFEGIENPEFYPSTDVPPGGILLPAKRQL